MSVGPSPMAIKRLKQDLMDMESDPTPGQWAKPDPANIMKWWYCIKGPKDTPYERGYYVGHLLFPKDYPFKGPEIYMMTPNGRLAPGRKLCLSISSYHPESWSPMWGPRTIINGISSFMAEESVGIGSILESNEKRQKLADASGEWNKKNFKDFHEYFPEALGEILDKEDSSKSAGPSKKPPKKSYPDNSAEVEKIKEDRKAKLARLPLVRNLPQFPARKNARAGALQAPAKAEPKPEQAAPPSPKRVRPVQTQAIIIDSDEEDKPQPLQNPSKKKKTNDVIVID